ncbi:hypothetical protein B0H12DRAFT_1328541 [Mycena haematopus]|nr:hypothetical protein B0H12DRAFT_1328541 [Mycena haematopus]
MFNPSHLCTWLSQATIFLANCTHHQFEDYVWLWEIQFCLSIFETTGDPPTSFLFLCPAEDFQTSPSLFCWPAQAAYWSLDPSGVDRLSLEDATQLGFPSFELTTTADGDSWDASVYDGLRQFHQAKGFDPESQDIAQHLGYRLYQLASNSNTRLTCVDGEDDSDGYAPDDESEYTPHTSVCEDSDIDAESSHYEENVHDPVNQISSVSEPTVEEDLREQPMFHEETLALSKTFKFLIDVQSCSFYFSQCVGFTIMFNQLETQSLLFFVCLLQL